MYGDLRWGKPSVSGGTEQFQEAAMQGGKEDVGRENIDEGGEGHTSSEL